MTMSKAMRVCALVVLAVGLYVPAEASVQLDVLICQGTSFCQAFGPATPGGSSGTITAAGPITIGDFVVQAGSVAYLESVGLSQSATTAINVQRTSTANAGAGNDLNIWLNATGYGLPVGPNVFATTLSATSSDGSAPVGVSFQGWFSDASLIGFPPAGSQTSGASGCTLAAGVIGSCAAPTVSGAIAGFAPFGMTTRTTFTIATADLNATYTSGGQANIIAAPVPEPASMFLLGTGLVAVARYGRRRLKGRQA